MELIELKSIRRSMHFTYTLCGQVCQQGLPCCCRTILYAAGLRHTLKTVFFVAYGCDEELGVIEITNVPPAIKNSLQEAPPSLCVDVHG